MATHYDIVGVDSVPSTQDVAARYRDGRGRSTLVVAAHQTAGRGRQGRSWEEPARGMFSSFAFVSDWPPQERAVIALCTSVALAEAVERIGGNTRCRVKWPNDVVIDGDKVAGILVESVGDTITVGCGVNLWWPDAPAYAAAVFDEDPGSDVARELATSWVDRLVEILEAGPRSWPREEYIRRSWTLGREVAWQGGEGVGVDIAAHGGLVVDTVTGRIVITAGEVHTRQRR